jgi:hypothetical protein
MAQFRKILLSGSNAHVSQVTASNIPQATDNNTVLFADSNGRVRTLSSLTYNSTDVSLEFNNGTFSGSFSGDGTGLTGVTAQLNNSIIDGAGVKSFSYDGSTGATASLDLAPAGGLTFYNGNTDAGTATGAGTDDYQLGITSSLAGDGLQFPNANDYSILRIDLDGTSNGTSGLKTGSNGLAISDNIDGNGLSLSSGILAVDLASNSGLQIDTAELQLHDNLPGNGLTYTTTNSVIGIDTSVVVDDDNTITFKTGSTNIVISLTQDSGGTGVQDVTGGKQARLIKNPVLELNLNDTLTGDFTFNGDVTIQGDLLVSGTGTEVNLLTQNLNIADQFILVNSGSTSTDGGFIVNTSDTNGAFFFYDNTKNRWGVSTEIAKSTTTFTAGVTNDTSMIAVVEKTSNAESSFINGNPQFGTDDNSRLGCIKVTTNPASNESTAYIYA